MTYSGLKNKIIIVSSRRTGSTALLYDIAEFYRQKDPSFMLLNETSVKGFAPVEIADNPSISETAFADILQNKNFALKAHAFDIERFYPKIIFDAINSDDVSVVKIRRSNFLEQCISTYVSKQTNIWFCDGKSNIALSETNISIDMTEIKQVIETTRQFNQALDRITKCDLDLVYEDCSFSTKWVVKNNKTKNHDQLETVFKRLIGE